METSNVRRFRPQEFIIRSVRVDNSWCFKGKWNSSRNHIEIGSLDKLLFFLSESNSINAFFALIRRYGGVFRNPHFLQINAVPNMFPQVYGLVWSGLQ